MCFGDWCHHWSSQKIMLANIPAEPHRAHDTPCVRAQRLRHHGLRGDISCTRFTRAFHFVQIAHVLHDTRYIIRYLLSNWIKMSNTGYWKEAKLLTALRSPHPAQFSQTVPADLPQQGKQKHPIAPEPAQRYEGRSWDPTRIASKSMQSHWCQISRSILCREPRCRVIYTIRMCGHFTAIVNSWSASND